MKEKHPVEILEDFLWKMLPGNYQPYGYTFDWKVSKLFFDDDFSNLENIEADFQHEYEVVVAKIQEVWGPADFRGNADTGSPDWYWNSIIEMSCWDKEEGIAYVAYHRDDKELPYEITLGTIFEEALEEEW
ncbi:hypothetical protein [Acaryochloris marina]|uniref:hypothetical protein n=1 Tax=Acaryochloris marina TaxID=155978 RepID=UPI001BAE6890|nr:hypothetical protein [Acaryochloris marina]QUY43277.1 hypothetical protein I1H34_03750 [Acaryochloris marina S15]